MTHHKHGSRITKLSALVLLLFANTKIASATPTVPLYTLYSPAYETLFENWFRPSIKDKNYKLIAKRMPQRWGVGKSNGDARLAMLDKVDVIIEALEQNYGGIFVFSDVDVIFFQPTWPTIASSIEDNDIVIQGSWPGGKASDTGILCTGFFACHSNEKTLRIWQDVRSKTVEGKLVEQYAFNMLIKHHNDHYQIHYALLPDTFAVGPACYGTWLAHAHQPPFSVPQNLILFHANYAQPIENKIGLLCYVRGIIDAISRTSSDNHGTAVP